MEDNEQMVEQKEPEVNESPATAKNPQTRKYTDAEVDEIINKKFAKWQKEQEQKVEEAKRLEKMNAEEKARYERDELQKELDQLKAEKAHNEMARTASAIIYKATNIQPPTGLVDILVGKTADETNEAVKGFIAFNDEYSKMRLGGAMPKKGTSSALTKDEILAIKDDKERIEAIRQNMELFKK